MKKAKPATTKQPEQPEQKQPGPKPDLLKIEEAYERTVKGDVRYRFVIDIASLKGER